MVKTQKFEDPDIKALVPVKHEVRSDSRPLIAILSDPGNILHCDNISTVSAFKSLSGAWSSIKARTGTPSSSRDYSIRAGPLPIGSSQLYLFKDEKLISDFNTDSEGKTTIEIPSSKPTTGNYTVAMTPELAPIDNPFQDSFIFSLWLVKCYVRNKTDIWWRFAGRKFESGLPRKFWSNALYTIGLGSPSGTQTFIDLVPVFGDKSAILEYGISAFCNTTNPYPTTEECERARKNTWWEFIVEITNGSVTKQVKADLNIDYHLQVTITANDISGTRIEVS